MGMSTLGMSMLELKKLEYIHFLNIFKYSSKKNLLSDKTIPSKFVDNYYQYNLDCFYRYKWFCLILEKEELADCTTSFIYPINPQKYCSFKKIKKLKIFLTIKLKIKFRSPIMANKSE